MLLMPFVMVVGLYAQKYSVLKRYALEDIFVTSCTENSKSDLFRPYCQCIWNLGTIGLSDKTIERADEGREPEMTIMRSSIGASVPFCKKRYYPGQ